jgi:hypothetical protein
MFKKATRPSTPGVRSSIQTTAPILRQGEVEQKRKKKGVTWADQIPQPIPSKEFPLQEATAAIGTHRNLVPMKEDAGTVDAVVLEDYTDLAGLVEISETTESGQPASTADGTEQCTSVSFVDESASSLARFRLSSISTQASGSDAIEDASGTWVEEPINQSSSHEIAGWDSDLTELTDSQEEAESQDGSSETEVNDVRWEKNHLPPLLSFLHLSSNITGPTSFRTKWAEDPHSGSSRWSLFQKMRIPQVQPTPFRWLSLEVVRFMSSKKSRLPTPKAKSARQAFAVGPRIAG